MLTRTLQDLTCLGQIRYPADNAFRSARFLTAQDGFGFSYNENKMSQAQDLTVWLKHHWEANYILAGSGQVTDLTSGETWPLHPGTLYLVGPNDRHRLQLSSDEAHLSVFHPALKGDETFDEDGAYSASGPIPMTDRRMFLKRDGEAHSASQAPLPLLTEQDAIGFTLSVLHLAPGANFTQAPGPAALHIVSGAGEAEAGGQALLLSSSMLLAAEPGERIRLTAHEELHLVEVRSVSGD